MKKVIGFLVLSVAFMACASKPEPRIVWQSTQMGRNFASDNYECTLQSQTTWASWGTGMAGMFGAIAARNDANARAQALYDMCMEAKGYYKRPE